MTTDYPRCPRCRSHARFEAELQALVDQYRLGSDIHTQSLIGSLESAKLELHRHDQDKLGELEVRHGDP